MSNTNNAESKALTIVIPAYNSESYLTNCIEPLLEAGPGLEVIVVNDGSSDGTLELARSYETQHPHVVRAVDQPNSGWGGAINHGIDLATGEYIFVLDSDDKLDTEALARLLELMRSMIADGSAPDLFVTNYVYDHMEDDSQHAIRYRNIFPASRVFGWDDVVKKPKIDEYLMIHAMTFRTEIVRRTIGKLPEKVSYMDSLLCLRPMPEVDTLYYLDEDLYYYTIGREGQTIDMEVLKKHIDEQYLAAKLAIDGMDYSSLAKKSPGLALCASRYLSAMLTVSCIYTYKLNEPDKLAKLEELWDHLVEKDPQMYAALKGTFARTVHRKSTLGRCAMKVGYCFARKVFKFA